MTNQGVVATSTVDKLLDYVLNTPEDGMRSKVCVEQRCGLIEMNLRRTARWFGEAVVSTADRRDYGARVTRTR